MGNRVAIAYLHPDEVGHNFCQSLLHTVMHDRNHAGHIVEVLPQRCSSGGLVAGRNHAAKVFLDDLDAQWLWWIDSDMGWRPDTLDRLLEVADREHRPVVGGLCMSWLQTGPDGMGGWNHIARPTIYQWCDTPEGPRFRAVDQVPDQDLVRCAATGSAMLLIHRDALAAVRYEHGDHWYDRIPTSAGDGHMSEDISFCARLGALDIPIHVDTRIATNHLKTAYVGEGHAVPGGLRV